jgi:hypothetical protein
LRCHRMSSDLVVGAVCYFTGEILPGISM